MVIPGSASPGSPCVLPMPQPLERSFCTGPQDARATCFSTSPTWVHNRSVVHRTFSNLKTGLKGTHHGVNSKHLPHYINEFVFRFNRRRMLAAFQSLLGLTAQHAPTTYKMLYAAEPTG